MKTSPRLFAVLLALAVLPLAQILYPGCATLVDGPLQHLRVKSKPTGARVFLNGHAVGETPVTVTMSRWGVHRLRVELAGFEPFEMKLEKYGNWNALGGNVLLGVAPIVIDAVSGAIFEISVPESAKRQLIPNRWEKGDEGKLITVGLHPLGPARKIGQMERRKK